MKTLSATVLFFIPTLLLAQQPGPAPVAPPDTTAGRIFQLGEVSVVATKAADQQDRVSAATMAAQGKLDVPDALNLLPGIAATASGNRNESMVSVRGFDLRQVPVYMDGIPVYVPYDGYVDLGRFSTADLAVIDVSKSLSSVLYGPNSLGGAINLVSRKPEKQFEVDGAVGTINDNGYLGNINLGTRQRKFYVQGGYSYLHRDAFILPESFTPTKTENGGQRENSYRTDGKLSLKFGWTPNAKHEYVVGYINQRGEKGNPTYAGEDMRNSQITKPRYWQWPHWDKETIYFLSSTALTAQSHLRAKLYYDAFTNEIKAFDNATYTTQNKPSSFTSYYDDYTYGGGLEYGTTRIPKNTVRLALQYKTDVHREHDLGMPVRTFNDNTITVGVEDSWRLTDKFQLVPGIGYSVRNNTRADDFIAGTETIQPYPDAGASEAWNGQLGLFYLPKDGHKLGLSASHRTRFATIKDRYSYRMGTAIPNPGLSPETADNLELSYTGRAAKRLFVQGALFYSSITDVIMSISEVQPGKAQMRNAGRAEYAGVEAGLTYDLRKNLSATANYTYIERRNLEDPVLRFTDVPDTKVIGTLTYKPVERLRLIASAEHNSSRYSTSYGTKADAFTLLNAFISGKVWKYASVDLGVNNLFDTNYCLVEGYPEEGRNFILTLRFQNHE
ncbi:MAG: TonB-dependent receptor [Flavobacteriales bacterium]|nr:TonB-dependent receptor [Flavobacteriales bacterium]